MRKGNFTDVLEVKPGSHQITIEVAWDDNKKTEKIMGQFRAGESRGRWTSTWAGSGRTWTWSGGSEALPSWITKPSCGARSWKPARAQEQGEVPIGAVLVVEDGDRRLGLQPAHRSHDPTAHAEVVTLRAAARALVELPPAGQHALRDPRALPACAWGRSCRPGSGPWSTARPRPKGGAVRSLLRVDDLPLNHRFEVVEGVLAEESRQLLQDFFKARRGNG